MLQRKYKIYKMLQVFFADIIVFSKSTTEHDRHLKALFDCLNLNRLEINNENFLFKRTNLYL